MKWQYVVAMPKLERERDPRTRRVEEERTKKVVLHTFVGDVFSRPYTHYSISQSLKKYNQERVKEARWVRTSFDVERKRKRIAEHDSLLSIFLSIPRFPSSVDLFKIIGEKFSLWHCHGRLSSSIVAILDSFGPEYANQLLSVCLSPPPLTHLFDFDWPSTC